MITIDIQRKESIICIKPNGRLDTINSAQFDNTIKEISTKEIYLIVDFSRCNYLSSTGIRVLLSIYKKLKIKGGSLFIATISPEVFQVIEMVGLDQFFHFSNNCQSAIDEIEQLKKKKNTEINLNTSRHHFTFSPVIPHKSSAHYWLNEGIVGYNELGLSIGIGHSAESLENDTVRDNLFFATGNCAGFVPNTLNNTSDFRISYYPSQAGIHVNQAISFGQCYSGLIRFDKPTSISMESFIDEIISLKPQLSNKQTGLTGLVVANSHALHPSLIVGLMADKEASILLEQKGFKKLLNRASLTTRELVFWGAQFELNTIVHSIDSSSLIPFLEENLTLENIINAKAIDQSEILSDPMCWLYLSKNIENASSHRINIIAPEEVFNEPYKAFLTRRLYNDSIRVELKQLHGGFSAQTFQVDSYDKNNRQLRPTVLKIADRAMITREAEQCKKYALPYIFNNSAMVLGTQFFGNQGALCYNFVGIGGEQTKLKWLTYYFEKEDVQKLEHLFDKVFLQILNPWYGQPIREFIYPFKEHDPTLSFFPQIAEKAGQLFSISTDQPFIEPEDIQYKVTNPYWFLKHEYPKQSETAIEYYTTICHGDLNMQNILLDQNENIYLIDFSETKPRSVVSDFARLEAIFMIEYAPVDQDTDIKEMVEFARSFYSINSLDQHPKNNYKGKHTTIMNRNIALSLKMRTYALQSAKGETILIPYYMALLEWILPIVCFHASYNTKRFSMLVAGFLCEKIMELLPSQTLNNN